MYLDHTNPDSITHNTKRVLATLKGLRACLADAAVRYIRASPQYCDALSVSTESDDGDLDVRLVANSDSELWFATGDVQYDTVHGTACEAVTISATDTDAELEERAKELVQGVADQLAEQGA